MVTRAFAPDELADAWIEAEPGARWSSASGHGPADGAAASGTSLLEVPVGCRLPPHTDSAEETIVVVAGEADVHVGGESERVGPGATALVPAHVRHEVRNAGSEPLRFVAVYAAADVVTTYEAPVQPDGSRERRTVG